jgi:hypothetical protein
MYILIDHVGRTIHPLGEKPLDAAVEFCKYAKDCKPDSGLYPQGCGSAAFDAFLWNVTDGTASELFEMVQMATYRVKQGTSLSRIFEVRIVPRPACWECEHWKSDGAFCECGEREQSSAEPSCRAWCVPYTEWKDVRPVRIRRSTPRSAKPFTEFDRENLQNLLVEFLEKKGGVATIREIKRRFKRSDPTAVPTALNALIADGWIVRARRIGKRRGRPSVLYRLKDIEPSP